MTASKVFVLTDETGRTLPVTVSVAGGFLNLMPAGYGRGNPVASLDFHEGRLRLLVDAVPDVPGAPEPDTEIVDLTPVKDGPS